VTDKTDEPVGIAGLKPTAHSEWKAREGLLAELRAKLNVRLPQKGRDRYVKALEAAAVVISQIGDEKHDSYTIQHDVSYALEQLAQMLKGLDRGIVDDSIRPIPSAKGGNYATAATLETALMARTAYRLLLQTGMPSRRAREKVAKELGVSVSQVKNWATRGRLPIGR
jgi:hypothetical protein